MPDSLEPSDRRGRSYLMVGRSPTGLRPRIVKGLLRQGGTFLLAGAGLLMIAGAEAAFETRRFLLLLFAVLIAALWFGAGSLMVRAVVSEACWDERAIYLALAFEARAVSWSDVLAVRLLTPEGWPTPGAAALVLLRYRHRIKGQQKHSWALLAVRQDRAASS